MKLSTNINLYKVLTSNALDELEHALANQVEELVKQYQDQNGGTMQEGYSLIDNISHDAYVLNVSVTFDYA